jgi:hypothetical protein
VTPGIVGRTDVTSAPSTLLDDREHDAPHNDYTLRQVDGAWKVVDSTWWRFYDPATGQFGTGP